MIVIVLIFTLSFFNYSLFYVMCYFISFYFFTLDFFRYAHAYRGTGSYAPGWNLVHQTLRPNALARCSMCFNDLCRPVSVYTLPDSFS